MAGGGGREAMDGGREAMARFVEFVKQYPGPEQVDLCVEIEVPGSWFGGNLNATERSLKYKAQEVEYDGEFPGLTPKSYKTKEKAIRFLCIVDAVVDPNSDGYWMKMSQWNRFRHDKFKERRDEELPFISKAAVATVVNAAANAAACAEAGPEREHDCRRHLSRQHLLLTHGLATAHDG
jgi:hypothetical protein